MSASQRRKGAQGERELADFLSSVLGRAVKRKLGQARDGGDDIQIEKFRIEVKRRRGIACEEWLEQAENSCKPGDLPIVMMRADGGEWMALMRLSDFLPMLSGELGSKAGCLHE